VHQKRLWQLQHAHHGESPWTARNAFSTETVELMARTRLASFSPKETCFSHLLSRSFPHQSLGHQDFNLSMTLPRYSHQMLASIRYKYHNHASNNLCYC
jgi:hypothetical protein